MMDHPVYTMTVMPLGASVIVDASTTVLQALEAAGIDLPSSCRNGTCRTCLCRLRAGEVTYTIDWPGLSVDERRDGDILPCVALARADLVLDVPLARRVATGRD
ncbi:2Fe-2S iron-sulfur cluster-binding protein [Massilia sp. MP_M2]|uniref:2Fe-2S iron-sulfur cluster-binding protein n=1 Tax=Massilia sp. MP_M2 TaxID=3071713 RepID=UPI00387E93F6